MGGTSGGLSIGHPSDFQWRGVVDDGQCRQRPGLGKAGVTAQFNALVVSDSSVINSTVNVATAIATAPKLFSYYVGNYAAFGNVLDSQANIASNLDALGKLNTQLATLVVSDNAVFSTAISTVDVLALARKTFYRSSTSNWLEKFSNVADSAQNIAISLDGLQAISAQLSKINLTDKGTPSLSISYASFSADATALRDIASAYTIAVHGVTVAGLASTLVTTLGKSQVASVTLTDSAANVFSALNTLQAKVTKISSISLTDTVAANLTLTATQFKAEAAIISRIDGTYGLTITGEKAANVAADAANPHVTSIAVTDSAANVFAKIAALESNIGAISSITLTDASKPTLTLGVATVAADTDVLNDIQSSYLLSIKDKASAINSLDLSTVNAPGIEIMPTVLDGVLTVSVPVADLNLGLISLTGDSINEKVFNITGTEVDIVSNATGKVLNSLFLTQDTEAQLHLLGIGSTVVHIL